VTAVSVEGGRVLVAPEIELSEDEVVLDRGGRREAVPRSRVVSVRSFRFWLGSDRLGRDMLRQLLAGGRISLAIALLSVTVALLVGGVVGTAAGSFGGLVDGLLMRLVDALLAFPVLFLMILAAALFRPGPTTLVAILGLTSWMGLARLVRGQVLSLRSRPFVLAARASGSSWPRIAAWHYAPNMVGPVAQDTALRMGDLVLAEATLSFLGLGVPPTVPSWGALVAEGQRAMLDGWWVAVLPGLAIAVLVISLALIGDGLQQLGEASA
jgi:peptide/nickel transport system permease protein